MYLALDNQPVVAVKVRTVGIGLLFDAQMPNGAIETSAEFEYIRDFCARAGYRVVEFTAA